MATEAEIEAGAANMYGKNWHSEDPHKRPGENMKNVWRKYAKDCLEGAEKGKFKPVVIYYEEANFTEMVLKDVPTVWVLHHAGQWPIELGYDFEGNLIGFRIHSDVSKKK